MNRDKIKDLLTICQMPCCGLGADHVTRCRVVRGATARIIELPS